MSERLIQVTTDGVKEIKLRCPKCGLWGYLDDDQIHGRISTQCPNPKCDYHMTVDWSKHFNQYGIKHECHPC